MTIRLTWSLFLLSISIPGLLLWFPVFLTTAYSVHNFKKTGPIWDTWDEIAQYKLIYGWLFDPFVLPVHSDDVRRPNVWFVRLVWSNSSHLAARRYNLLRYTSVDVDDSQVCPLSHF